MPTNNPEAGADQRLGGRSPTDGRAGDLLARDRAAGAKRTGHDGATKGPAALNRL